MYTKKVVIYQEKVFINEHTSEELYEYTFL